VVELMQQYNSSSLEKRLEAAVGTALAVWQCMDATPWWLQPTLAGWQFSTWQGEGATMTYLASGYQTAMTSKYNNRSPGQPNIIFGFSLN